jgi:hypothetical protein
MAESVPLRTRTRISWRERTLRSHHLTRRTPVKQARGADFALVMFLAITRDAFRESPRTKQSPQKGIHGTFRPHVVRRRQETLTRCPAAASAQSETTQMPPCKPLKVSEQYFEGDKRHGVAPPSSCHWQSRTRSYALLVHDHLLTTSR